MLPLNKSILTVSAAELYGIVVVVRRPFIRLSHAGIQSKRLYNTYPHTFSTVE